MRAQLLFKTLLLILFLSFNANAMAYTWTTVNPSPFIDAQGMAESDTTSAKGSVMVGLGGKIFHSTDNTAWTAVVSGTSNDINAVIWDTSTGLFVAVGNNVILTSTDGITWIDKTPATAVGVLTWVVKGNSGFVAGGLTGAAVNSATGATWSSQATGVPTTTRFNAVTSSGTLIVGVGYDTTFGGSPVVYTTTDGITWSIKTVSITGRQFYAAYWDGSQFIIAGQENVSVSTNGTAWAAKIVSNSPPKNISAITSIPTATGNILVLSASGSPFSATGGRIFTSTDNGSTWAENAAGTTLSATGLFQLGGKAYAIYPAVAGFPADIKNSSNGTTWTAIITDVITNTATSLNDVVYGSNQYVAVGKEYLTSADGVTWKSQGSFTQIARHVVWDGTQFTAVGDRGLIATSTDGINWTEQTSNTSANLTKVVSKGSTLLAFKPWLATNNRASVFTSTNNGTTWTTTTLGARIFDVASDGTKFVGVGQRSALAISADGLTWDETKSVAGTGIVGVKNFTRIESNGNLFVAFGQSQFDPVVISPNGISWAATNPVRVMTANDAVWTGGLWAIVSGSSSASTTDFSTVNTVPVAGSALGIAWNGVDQLVAVGGHVIQHSVGRVNPVAADTVPAVITPPANITVKATNNQGIPSASTTIQNFLNAVSAVDNIDGTISVITNDAPAVIPLPSTKSFQVTTVNFSATDSAGNTGTASATITVIDNVPPVISLIGTNPFTLELGTNFTDPGTTVTDNHNTGLQALSDARNAVNTLVAGSYTVTYTVSDSSGNAATPVTRVVNVVDTVAPVISFFAPATQYAAQDANGLVLAGSPVETLINRFQATDAAGIASLVNDAPAVLSIGVTKVTFTAIDKNGLQATRSLNINVVDATKPVITLTNGNITINQLSTFTDPGFIATDNVDGDISANVQVAGSIDTVVPGDYVLAYSVTDAAGNMQSVRRTVTVAPVTVTNTCMDGVLGSLLVQGGGVSRSASCFVPESFATSPSVFSWSAASPQFSMASWRIQMDPSGLIAIDNGIYYWLELNQNGTAAANGVTVDNTNNTVTFDNTVVKGAGVFAPGSVVLNGILKFIPSTVTPNTQGTVSLTGGGTVNVSTTTTGASVNNTSIAASSVVNPPAGISFLFDVVSYKATVNNAGGSITTKLTYSSVIPSAADIVLYKVDFNGNYTRIPASQWQRVDNFTIALTLTDGGQFDLDGAANGEIIDPVALGSTASASTTTPTTSATSLSYNGRGIGSMSPWFVLIICLYVFVSYANRRLNFRK